MFSIPKIEFNYGGGSTQNSSRQGVKGDTLFGKSTRDLHDNSRFSAFEDPADGRVFRDEICLEASEHARVWHVYNEESTKKDAAITDACNRNIDVLLVFTGLFSAVLTTFIVIAYQQMGPQPSDTTNALLTQLISLQAAALNSTNNNNGIDFESLVKSLTLSPGEIHWVNGLWFAALCCSLSTALVSMLAKQWLHIASYISGSPKSRARQRQRRYMQLQNWRVFVVISALPLLLHAALLLFFAGLIVFLWSGDIAIATAIFAIVGLAYVFYIGSMWLSLVDPNCPYQHPISEQLRLWTIWNKTRFEPWDLNDLENGVDEKLQLSRRVAISPPKIDPDDYNDACALVWMLQECSSDDIVTITLQAIGGLPRDFSAFHVLRNAGAVRLTLQRFASCFYRDSSFGVEWHILDPQGAERYCRSWMRLTRGTMERWPCDLLRPLDKLASIQGHPHISVIASCACALDSLDSRSPQLALINHLEKFVNGESNFSQPIQCWLLDTLLECSIGWELEAAVIEDIARRVIPLLLQLLHLTKHALASQPRNAIALTLCSLTRGSIDPSLFSDENKRQEDFHKVIIPSLAAIIRDPVRFGVKDDLLDITSIEFSRLSAPVLMGSRRLLRDLKTTTQLTLSKLYLDGRIGFGLVSDYVLADILRILHPPVDITHEQRPLFVTTLLHTLRATTDSNVTICSVRLLEPLLVDCHLPLIRVFLEGNGISALLRASHAGDTDSRKLQLDCMRTLCIFLRRTAACHLQQKEPSVLHPSSEIKLDTIFNSDFFTTLLSIISVQRWWLEEIAEIWLPSLLELCEVTPGEHIWRSVETVFRQFAENHDGEDKYPRMLRDLDRMKDILGSSPQLEH